MRMQTWNHHALAIVSTHHQDSQCYNGEGEERLGVIVNIRVRVGARVRVIPVGSGSG